MKGASRTLVLTALVAPPASRSRKGSRYNFQERPSPTRASRILRRLRPRTADSKPDLSGIWAYARWSDPLLRAAATTAINSPAAPVTIGFPQRRPYRSVRFNSGLPVITTQAPVVTATLRQGLSSDLKVLCPGAGAAARCGGGPTSSVHFAFSSLLVRSIRLVC